MKLLLCVATVFVLGCGGAASQYADRPVYSALTQAEQRVAEARAKDAQAAAALNEAERIKREAELNKASARSGVLGALGGMVAAADARLRVLTEQRALAAAELANENRALREEYARSRDRRQGVVPHSRGDRQRDDASSIEERGNRDHSRRATPSPTDTCWLRRGGCPVHEDAPPPAIYFKVNKWSVGGVVRYGPKPAHYWKLVYNLPDRNLRLEVNDAAVWQALAGADIFLGKCYRGQVVAPQLTEVACVNIGAQPSPAVQGGPPPRPNTTTAH